MNSNSDSLDLEEDLNQLKSQSLPKNNKKMDSSIPDFKDIDDFKLFNEIDYDNIGLRQNDEPFQSDLANGKISPVLDENEELDQAIIMENTYKKDELNDNNDKILVGIEEEGKKTGCVACENCKLI
jgi:hypothetical protein